MTLLRIGEIGASLLLSIALVAMAAGACRSAAPIDPPAPAAAAETDGGSTSAERAAAEVYSNTIKWATASELDNFGYDVYRAESENGPWERINPEVIEGAGTTDEPSYYRYVDRGIDPGKTYYYYVESISMSGVRERFTPVGEAPPKIPPE